MPEQARVSNGAAAPSDTEVKTAWKTSTRLGEESGRVHPNPDPRSSTGMSTNTPVRHVKDYQLKLSVLHHGIVRLSYFSLISSSFYAEITSDLKTNYKHAKILIHPLPRFPNKGNNLYFLKLIKRTNFMHFINITTNSS